MSSQYLPPLPEPTPGVFPNGLTLTSTAQTPDTMALIFQPIIAQILGYDTSLLDTSAAYYTVRTAWPEEGQPGLPIDRDVCIIRFTLDNEAFARVRDSRYDPNDSVSLTQSMAFTQVWNFHATLYGPNTADRARLILSAMSLDWVHDLLAPRNIYVIPDWKRPEYVPELFQGRWWKRTDLTLRFNELVNESLVVPSTAEADVTLITDTGVSEEITISST